MNGRHKFNKSAQTQRKGFFSTRQWTLRESIAGAVIHKNRHKYDNVYGIFVACITVIDLLILTGFVISHATSNFMVPN